MENKVIDSLLSGLIGAIIGALTGGFVSAWGSYFFTKKHTKELENKKMLNFASAIYIELTSLKERYMEIAGNLIEKIDADKEIPIIGILQTNQSYFTVFDNLSPDLLGLLNSETSKNIINAYINVKALFDELVAFGNQWKFFYDLMISSVLIKYTEFKKCTNSKKLTKSEGTVIEIDKLKSLLQETMKTSSAPQYFKNYDPIFLFNDIIEYNKYLKKRHDNIIGIVDKAIDGL